MAIAESCSAAYLVGQVLYRVLGDTRSAAHSFYCFIWPFTPLTIRPVQHADSISHSCIIQASREGSTHSSFSTQSRTCLVDTPKLASTNPSTNMSSTALRRKLLVMSELTFEAIHSSESRRMLENLWLDVESSLAAQPLQPEDKDLFAGLVVNHRVLARMMNRSESLRETLISDLENELQKDSSGTS
jgi:hypothetical protein